MGKIGTYTESDAVCAQLQRLIGQPISTVVLADCTVPAPPRALMPRFARIFIACSGCRHTLIAHRGEIVETRLSAGDVLFIGSQAWHHELPRSAYSLVSMNLRPHHSSITWKKHARNQQRVFLRNHTAATPISSATRGIVQVLDRLSSDEDEIAKHLVMALLRTVHADACKPGPVANRAIARFEAISDHLLENCHLPIDRQTVAREFHMHPNHLSRLFRTQAGESFTDHLTQLRMERACNCLATRRWSVQDVASMCGFASANYFSKVFHKHHGVSPSEWKP